MKLKILQKSLNKALSAAARAAAKRTQIPILSNILFEASDERVIISGTDLDIEIKSNTEASVAQGGSVCVSAEPFLNISKKIAENADVSIELDDSRLTIKSGRAKFHLNTLPAAEWPEITSKDTPHKFTIKSKSLQKILEKVMFAISTEETRYYLNGIYMHIAASDGAARLKAVATDGHRLSLVSSDVPTGAENMPGVIIPRKTVSEVMRLLADAPDDASIQLAENFIIFDFGHTIISSKIIDGTFPDYMRVIPTASETTANLDKKSTGEAVARVSTISGERGRAVKFSFDKDKLSLSVVNPDMGDAVDEVEADYDFKKIEIGFNSSYVQECLASLDGDNFNMKLTDAGAPCVMSADDPDHFIVLMPMRV